MGNLCKSSIVIMNKRTRCEKIVEVEGNRWLQHENIKIPVCKELSDLKDL